jgi:hypothetical protein
MELFTQLFGKLRMSVYHCFDRIVIHGYAARSPTCRAVTRYGVTSADSVPAFGPDLRIECR